MEESFEKQLMQSQIEVQEFTAEALSQELHDNIGQLLSSTKLMLSVGLREMQQVSDILQTAESTLAKAIQDLRMLTKSLNKDWLDQFDFVENIQTEVDRINLARSIAITLSIDYKKLPLEPKQQLLLFRVVQEALQNCIKHSEASTITVAIRDYNNKINILIQDNGRGFNPEAVKIKSLGLRNMEHRITLLNGKITWNSSIQSKGTLITIILPSLNERTN